MIVYIIECSGGEYDSSYSYISNKGYYSYDDASKVVEQRQRKNEYILDKEELYKKIEETLYAEIPDSYYEDDSEEDCCWDDFNIFISEIKRLLPEIYNTEGVDNLKILYDYYNNYEDLEYYRIIKVDVV